MHAFTDASGQTRALFLQVFEAVRANQKVAHDRAMHEVEKLSL